MKCVCPCCARVNRIPNRWAGHCFACTHCETQVSAPALEATRPRSWLASPGWVAVAGTGLAVLLGLVAMVGSLLWLGPPQGLPYVEGVEGAAQLAVPGEPVALVVATGQGSVGGYFRVVRKEAALATAGAEPREVGLRVEGQAPPAGLAAAEELPPDQRIALPCEVVLPPDERLAGREVEVRMKMELEVAQRRDGGVAMARSEVAARRRLRVATAEQRAALRGYRRRRTWLLVGVLACGAVLLGLAAGTAAYAKKEVTLICPVCGRATTGVFYHERGEVYISRCPHTSQRLQPAELPAEG
ncbi:MAG: hypothetical protein ACLF0G_06435 [Candidatus Brocadiia bacterium]